MIESDSRPIIHHSFYALALPAIKIAARTLPDDEIAVGCIAYLLRLMIK